MLRYFKPESIYILARNQHPVQESYFNSLSQGRQHSWSKFYFIASAGFHIKHSWCEAWYLGSLPNTLNVYSKYKFEEKENKSQNLD